MTFRVSYAFLIMTVLSGPLAAVGRSAGPTAPSGRANYAGDWLGATETGDGVAFVISPAQKVTGLSFSSYQVSGCSGAETVSGSGFRSAAGCTCRRIARFPVLLLRRQKVGRSGAADVITG